MNQGPARAKSDPTKFLFGDVVRLRKPHPCGSLEWTVVRLGADIGLRCNQCQRRVLLPRSTLERRLKAFVSRGPDPASNGGVDASEASPTSDTVGETTTA